MDTSKLNQHSKALQSRTERLALLRQKLGLDAKPPKGFYTTTELAKKMNMSTRGVLFIIHQWSDVGMCEVKKFRRKVVSDFKMVPHYKFHPELVKALGLDDPKEGRDAK